VVVLIAAACGGAVTPTAADPLAGVYRIGGGDAALSVVQALADGFAAKHPGVKFVYDTSLGSDGGINLAAQQVFDLGMASRDLTAAAGRVDLQRQGQRLVVARTFEVTSGDPARAGKRLERARDVRELRLRR
jgi:ABC-type phosphate transport system substrate-binding protein